ncbi:MAG: FAD-binding oxidoreductase [Gaiellaceae bacterium]
MSEATTAISVSQHRADLNGRVIAPGEPGYDEGRTVFYGGIDRRPAAIVRAADEDDVSRAIALARETGLELAIRSGGHSTPGHSTTEGGIVLDLRDLNGLQIDVEGRTAWVGGGVTTGRYTEAAAEHGLATPFGDTGSVGIGGLTLGGGIGFLVRKHGLTIDDMLAAEVVTADGQLLRVDAESHPDLFWAIRGGGGNFGVATRLQLRLHDLDGIVGGMLILPATADTIYGFMAEAEAAPEELSAIANVMPAPPMPFLPPEQHGQLVIFALLAYAGDVDGATRAVAPFRALAEPVADMVRPMRYPELFQGPGDEGEFHPVAVARTMYVDSIDHSAAETIVEQLQASTAMMAATQLRTLGGAAARVPVDATAYAHRRSRIMVNVAALVQAPEQAPEHEPWVVGLADALRQDDTGAYVNFLGDEGEERVRAAYPGPTWDRLVEIKRRYDPTNVFRLNQNIPTS